MALEGSLPAILSADVVGYSTLLSQDPDAAAKTIAAHRPFVTQLLGEHGGRLVGGGGDAFVARFDSASGAVQCALELQRGLSRRSAMPDLPPLLLQVGIHAADPIEEADRIRKEVLRVLGLLERACPPGGVCVSDAAIQEIQGAHGLEVEDLGERNLDSVWQTVRIYGIRTGVETDAPAPPAPPESTPQPVVRRLAAIMFTDLVGSTAQMAESEERALRAKRRHRELVRDQVQRYAGRLIDHPGDETLSLFESALDAVNSALALEAATASEEFKLHIAIHSGDVLLEGGEVHGDGVNIAARLKSLSEGGGICISSEVYQAVRNHPEIEATSLGEHELRNVGRPIHVYSIARGATAEAASEPAARDRSRPISARSMVLGAVAVGVVLLAAVVAWFWPRGPTPLQPIRSIAVPPLESLSADAEQEYFAGGLTEALIGDLAKIGSLRVVRYPHSEKPLSEIARELNVDGVVEGTVMRAGARVRITAQLIDARSGEYLWSEHYDRELSDVLALQSDVARAVAEQIRVELTPEDQARLAGSRRVDPEAHEAYLRGLHFLWTQFDERGFPRAADEFERSIELDPSYAPAHAGLSRARWHLRISGLSPAREMIPLQREAALKALELDENLPEAHVALGVSMYGEWNWQGAEQQFRRAIELNPNESDSAFSLGFLLTHTGRIDEAGPYFRRARELDPLSLNANAWLGRHMHLSGESQLALEQLSRTVRIYPDNFLPRIHLFQVYLDLGREAEAVVQLREMERVFPRPSANVARLRAQVGEAEEAEVELREAIALSGERYPFQVAEAWAALGETERAFDWLERAYEERSIPPRFWLSAPLGPMRSDPRFQNLLRRIGFPES